MTTFRRVAQLVEHRVHTPSVAGSSPAPATNLPNLPKSTTPPGHRSASSSSLSPAVGYVDRIDQFGIGQPSKSGHLPQGGWVGSSIGR